MKSMFYIVTFLIIFSACFNLEEKKPLNDVFTPDYLKFQNENELGIIDLDAMKNFSELIKEMQALSCQDKASGIKFEVNNTRYHMTGFSDCPTYGGTNCYFRRTYLYIINDSLILNDGRIRERKPITYLKTELNNIIAAESFYDGDKKHINPALISFFVEDTYPISTTKTVLKEIFEQFVLINSKNPDFYKYHIIFGPHFLMMPPPPPLE